MQIQDDRAIPLRGINAAGIVVDEGDFRFGGCETRVGSLSHGTSGNDSSCSKIDYSCKSGIRLIPRQADFHRGANPTWIRAARGGGKASGTPSVYVSNAQFNSNCQNCASAFIGDKVSRLRHMLVSKLGHVQISLRFLVGAFALRHCWQVLYKCAILLVIEQFST